MEALHVRQILVYRVCGSCIPLCLSDFLIWRKNRYAALVAIQIPRYADSDMRIQPQRLILCEDSNRVDPGVDAVTERKINDPVLPTESNCRFCNLRCQDTKP